MPTIDLRITLLILACASAVFAQTAPAERGGHRHPPPRPPQAAFDVCEGAEPGDECAVTTPDRVVEGTCEPFPGSDALACRPDGPPPPPPPAQ